jgi:DNA-binding YbaB/EbfC family protein
VNPFGNPQKLMKQLQQTQERIQQEISALSIEASSGGGMVRVTMSGEKKIQSLTIDPEVVTRDDVEMLQDLILTAVNEATHKVDQTVQEKIGGLAGGLKIPGLT